MTQKLSEFFVIYEGQKEKKTLTESLDENLLAETYLTELEGEGFDTDVPELEPVHEPDDFSMGCKVTQWEWAPSPNPMAKSVGPPDEEIEALYGLQGFGMDENHPWDTPNPDQWIPPETEGPMQREARLTETDVSDTENIVGQIRRQAADAAEVMITFDDDRKKRKFMDLLKQKGLVPQRDYFSDLDGVKAKAKALVRLNPQTIAKDIEQLEGGVSLGNDLAPTKPGFWRGGK